jgi:peptide/nickel transport system substrate-binding protein
MAKKRTYLQEAYDYYEERRRAWLGAQVPRSFIIKGTTLVALGGASAVTQLLAACASGAVEQSVTREISQEGAYKWSKYPFIEKYNFRNMPWPATPYVDGVHHRPQGAPRSWNVFRNGLQSYGIWLDTLRKKRYGAGANMLDEELQDNLASVTPAPDYSYYDYKIYPGVYFHDIPPVNGRLFTAEDAAYCVERYRTDSIHGAPLTIIDRVEVLPDKETMRVHVKRPILWLDHTLASNDYWMVAREHAEGDPNYFQNQPISTAPFKVLKSQSGTGGGIESVRHPGFGRQDSRWAGYQLPFMREVRNISLETTAALAAYRSGQVDYRNTIMPYNEFEDLLSTNPDSIIQIHAPNANYNDPWAFNVNNPPLDDVRVRRALNMAINRPEMIDVVWGGFASGQYPMTYPFQGLTDPLHPNDLGPWHQYNPSEAKRLLAEAGYPNGFELELMTDTTIDNDDVVAIQYLEAIGVRVRPVHLEASVLSTNRESRKFAHAVTGGRSATGWTAIKNAFEFYTPDSVKNYSGINDPVMTDLVERAAYTLDIDEQIQLIRKINERHMDQAYHLDKVVGFYIFFRRPWLHNVASAVQGQFCCWGTPQGAVAWIDDTAPDGRGGRLKA